MLAPRSSRCSTISANPFEGALWNNITVKGEYLHVDLGDQTVTLVAQPPAFGNGFATATFDNSYEIIRAGLNFRY
jgi:outer membrane immunogenic protein